MSLFIPDLFSFLFEACKLGRRLREKPVQAAQARRLENNYQQRLNKICARALAHPETEKLRLRLRENRAKLFTFIRHPEVGPTNNQAEQSEVLSDSELTFPGSASGRHCSAGDDGRHGARERHSI